jgi:two-component system CheB/CheR fusion protein
VRIMPYRKLDNLIDGVVMTFSEITKAKMLENELRAEIASIKNCETGTGIKPS